MSSWHVSKYLVVALSVSKTQPTRNANNLSNTCSMFYALISKPMPVNLEYTSSGMLCCHELRIIWQASERLKSCGNMSGLAPVGVSVPVATRTQWLRRDFFSLASGYVSWAFFFFTSYYLPGKGLTQICEVMLALAQIPISRNVEGDQKGL